MIWTDEAVEELKRMWDRGMTTGQIAKALNVTKKFNYRQSTPFMSDGEAFSYKKGTGNQKRKESG